MNAELAGLYRRIYAVVRRIPSGRVATYGQVAELAGIPGGGRVAGSAMKTSGKASGPGPREPFPWQRVIGKASKLRGRIAIHDPVGAAVQRELLEGEGVTVGETGLVALDVFGWLPSTAGSSRAASPRRRPRSASTRRASSSRR